MKKIILCILLIGFIAATGHAQTCPAFNVGGNAGFESALASNTRIGNWYGTQATPHIGGTRYATNEMTGSYVGVVYCDTAQNRETLSIDVLATDIDVQPMLRFDYRPKSFNTVFAYPAINAGGGHVAVTAYNASGTIVTDAVYSTSTYATWPLFGINWYSYYQYMYRDINAAVNNTYPVTLNIKSMVVAALLGTNGTNDDWTDVYTVRITFSCWCGLTASTPVKYYIDNFR